MGAADRIGLGEGRRGERGNEAVSIPHLRPIGETAQLIVDGAPYLILGGELGNSSASNLEYLKPHWSRIKALGLNTLLAPVYWDLIEPQEGRFDFTLIDGLIESAREHGLRLVLLWFGSWKNCMSCYVPEWIKRDPSRFPRAKSSTGRGLEMLSAFAEENVEADVRAFSALMRHLREVDEGRHTVIMVQVENEIGMIPEARDFSEAANKRFQGEVPRQLLTYLDRHIETLAPEVKAMWESQGRKLQGTWEDVFGQGIYTEELFMAWHFAAYVERVASAGKAEYPLPMFVNAALIRPGFLPGRYASGGPLPHLIDIWRAAAPAIDFLAPDIYFPNVVEWCKRYVIPGNPLFVPEIRRGPSNAANAFYTVGALGSLGFSPFSIESADEDEIDPTKTPLAEAYRLLRQLMPLILEKQGQDSMTGVAPELDYDGFARENTQKVSLGGYTMTVTFEGVGSSSIFGVPAAPPKETEALPGAELPTLTPTTAATATPASTHDSTQTATSTHTSTANYQPPELLPGGLLMALDEDEFLVAGTGLVITFETEDPCENAGILSAQEGEFVDGRWTPGRWLNGDQTHQGRHIRIPLGNFGIQRFRLYRYR